METGWYMEAEEQKQVVARVHCSMDHAIRDMQVGHTHGLLVAAGGPGGEGMEQLMLVEFGMEVEADDHMGEGDDHRQEQVAAQQTGSKVFGDEKDSFVYRIFDQADNKVFGDEKDLFVVCWILGFGFPLKGSCRYKHHCFCPGNSNQPLVSEHLQSFPCTGCSLSLQSHCSAALHL